MAANFTVFTLNLAKLVDNSDCVVVSVTLNLT
jgi:hypothetical protein